LALGEGFEKRKITLLGRCRQNPLIQICSRKEKWTRGPKKFPSHNKRRIAEEGSKVSGSRTGKANFRFVCRTSRTCKRLTCLLEQRKGRLCGVGGVCGGGGGGGLGVGFSDSGWGSKAGARTLSNLLAGLQNERQWQIVGDQRAPGKGRWKESLNGRFLPDCRGETDGLN